MNKELSDKYIAQMKNCTWEGDHEDADILICQFLEEIGYQDLADAYRKVPKWFSQQMILDMKNPFYFHLDSFGEYISGGKNSDSK